MEQERDRLQAENDRLRAETERLRAELERVRSRQAGALDLDAVFPALPALLFLFDAEDRYLDYRAGEGLFVPPERFLGRRIDEVLPAETARVFRQAMAQARATGQRLTVSYSLPFGDQVRAFQARISALTEDLVAMLCLDVTEQHAAEQAAQRSGRRIEHLLSVVPTVVYGLRLVRGGMALDSVSPNLERVLGYTADDVRDPGWWAEQVHPEDRERALAGISQVLADGRLTHIYRFRHADGSYRWIRDELRLACDESGKPAEIVGSFSDVTVERGAQELLRQGEERFRALIEHSSDLLMVFDERGLITFASPASAQALGVPAAELTGRHGFEFVDPEELPVWEGEFASLIASPGQTHQFEARARHHDGSWHLFAVSARNLLHDPAVRGIVVNNRDITEERRLAQQVLQVQKLESVGRLAGGVAHDFNNLLTGILGYAEILAEDIRAGRPNLADLDEIQRAGERARELTRQLLAFARRQVSRPVVIDMREALLESEKLLRRVLGEDVSLEVKASDVPLRVKLDPTHLQQVILNLAVNARDAMPGGGRLTLEASEVELGGGYVEDHLSSHHGPHVMLAVSDSGQGMSDEVRAHIFEPFFTTKPSGVGTGLGLATVYGIVKQAGGNIWVYSEPGRGTTFKLYFPLAEEATAPHEPPAGRTRQRGQETVLVVEDDASVRALTVRALASAGYRVLAAEGGQVALDLAGAAGHIDLLLTDVVMSGLSGKQVAEALRSTRPEMRVLFVSGYTQNTIVHHGVLDPDVEFLAKPFTPSMLLEKVRRVLDA